MYLWKPHGIYELRVDDNGIPFALDTLMEIGRQRTTTGACGGGKGIGFLTIFEIKDRYGASLIITERPPGPEPYTKTIAVRFDSQNQNIIQSYRAEKLQDMSRHKNMCWLIEEYKKIPASAEVQRL